MLPKGKTKLVCSHVDRQHSYLIKMGGTKNPTMTKISKSIWMFLLKKNIQLTAQWIPTIPGKQGIGLGVSKFKQLKRVETLSYYISPKERRKSKILSRFDEFLLNEHAPSFKDGKSSTSHHAVS